MNAPPFQLWTQTERVTIITLLATDVWGQCSKAKLPWCCSLPWPRSTCHGNSFRSCFWSSSPLYVLPKEKKREINAIVDVAASPFQPVMDGWMVMHTRPTREDIHSSLNTFQSSWMCAWLITSSEKRKAFSGAWKRMWKLKSNQIMFSQNGSFSCWATEEEPILLDVVMSMIPPSI